MDKELVILTGYLLTFTDLQKIIKKHPTAFLLADNPYVCELLESLNVSFLTVEDFVSSETISDEGIKNYIKLDSFFKIFDQTILSQFTGSNLGVFEPGLLERYYYTFKRIMDCVSMAFLFGAAIQKSLDFGTAYIYTEHFKQPKYSPGNYKFHEYFFIEALKITLSSKRVVTVNFKNPRGGAKKWLMNIARTTRNFAKLLPAMCKLVMLKYSRYPTILFTAKSYDLAFVYPQLEAQKDINTVIFNTTLCSSTILRCFLRVLGEKSFLANDKRLKSDILQPLLNVPLEFSASASAILKRAFLSILSVSYIRNFLSFQIGNTLARNYGVRSACSPCIGTSNESSFLYGLKQGGAKTFHYQHGGGQGYLYKPMFEWFFSQTNFLFCYGDAVKENMKVNERIPVFPVGSPRLEAVRNLVNKNINSSCKLKKLNLVCVPSAPNGYRSYFPEVKKTDLSYYLLWKQLLKSLSELRSELASSLSILIKSDHYFGQNADYFPRLIARQKYEGIDVVCGKPFINFIQQGDIFIIDGPETTILEVMLTNKPVILYFNGGYKLTEHFRELLEKRVYWVESPTQLQKVLRNIVLNYDACVQEKNDNAFLEYYLSKPESSSFFRDKFLLKNLS